MTLSLCRRCLTADRPCRTWCALEHTISELMGAVDSPSSVCGAAAASLEPQLVEDVEAFPGHIACDSASRSELVVPLLHSGELVGVIDLDSPRVGRFDREDLAGCLELARLLGPRLAAGSKAPPQALKKS